MNEELFALTVKVVVAIVIFIGFLVISSIFKKIILAAGEKKNLNAQVVNIVVGIERVFFIGLGVITSMGVLGVNMGALVASLGLTGFALGFALRDALSNLLSGILILFYRPFKIGDRITVAGHTGFVRYIDLRYTSIEENGKTVFIPNSSVFNSPVVLDNKSNKED